MTMTKQRDEFFKRVSDAWAVLRGEASVSEKLPCPSSACTCCLFPPRMPCAFEYDEAEIDKAWGLAVAQWLQLNLQRQA
jgi:hypothetical protein